MSLDNDGLLTTNATYGHFSPGYKPLPAEEENTSCDVITDKWGMYRDKQNFVKGLKTPSKLRKLNEQDKQDTRTPDKDDKKFTNPYALRLPPLAGRSQTIPWMSNNTKDPDETPVPDWFSIEPIRPQLPPATGYAKLYMQSECSRLWANLREDELLQTRGRLATAQPDVLVVMGTEVGPEVQGEVDVINETEIEEAKLASELQGDCDEQTDGVL